MMYEAVTAKGTKTTGSRSVFALQCVNAHVCVLTRCHHPQLLSDQKINNNKITQLHKRMRLPLMVNAFMAPPPTLKQSDHFHRSVTLGGVSVVTMTSARQSVRCMGAPLWLI